jgi:hypothetical protein
MQIRISLSNTSLFKNKCRYCKSGPIYDLIWTHATEKDINKFVARIIKDLNRFKFHSIYKKYRPVDLSRFNFNNRDLMFSVKFTKNRNPKIYEQCTVMYCSCWRTFWNYSSLENHSFDENSLRRSQNHHLVREVIGNF